MKPPMTHTAYKVTMTSNAYGDRIAGGTTPLKCHVRIINMLATTSSNEQIDSDALFWFEPDSGVVKGDVIKYQAEHYRVERLTEARRLRNPNVQFIKVECLKYGRIS
jgi:hypothetical protein